MKNRRRICRKNAPFVVENKVPAAESDLCNFYLCQPFPAPLVQEFQSSDLAFYFANKEA
jgi:hypothetical protein